jgi:hypothetical protein
MHHLTEKHNRFTRHFSRNAYILRFIEHTVTDSKLGRDLNAYCVLPGWARNLWFFSLCSYVLYLKINLTKFYSPPWNCLVVAAHLSKPSHSHLAVVFQNEMTKL